MDNLEYLIARAPMMIGVGVGHGRVNFSDLSVAQGLYEQNNSLKNSLQLDPGETCSFASSDDEKEGSLLVYKTSIRAKPLIYSPHALWRENQNTSR